MLKQKETYDETWKRRVSWLLIFQIAFFFTAIICAHANGLHSMPYEQSSIIVLDCLGMAVLTMLFASNLSIKKMNKISARFLLIIAIVCFYLFLDSIAWTIDGREDLVTLNIIVNTCFYIVTLILAWIFWYFFCAWINVSTNEMLYITRIIDAVAVVGIVLVLGNLLFGYYFTVGADGKYLRSSSFALSLIPPTIILVIFTVILLRFKLNLKDKLVFISYPIMPYIAMLFTLNTSEPTINSIVLFCSVIFVYCNIFIRQDSELAKKQAELADSRVNSMLLQINPHFIYNTLGSVASLCSDDPEKAKEMLFTFSNYLRNNFGEMTHKSLIPFSREMEHLNSYISIEKMRFPDIEFEIDINASNFMLPSLSVQPLVENAITHGIMGREQGGKIKISSRADRRNYYVTVEDDGVGFSQMPKNDGRNHIGISNVRNRLDMLCGGRLAITSTLDVGTICEIIIPKEEI